MSKRIITLLTMSFLALVTLPSKANEQKTTPAGSWKFEAPYAPEGYKSGKIEVVFSDNSYATAVSFAGSDYKIKGEKVKFGNENLSFSVNVEGTEVAISLKMESPQKMSGKAVYYEGEIPLTLLKEQESK